MKHSIQLFTLLALLISLPVYCQDDDPVYVIANRMPEFRGNLQDYLKQSIQYPQEALEQEMEGRVIVRMIINKDSTVSDVTVARSSGNELLDQEAVRVIEQMPKWSPAKNRNKVVRCRYTLPVTFRIPVDALPEFVGGDQAFLKYLKKKIKCPSDKLSQSVQCAFTIDETGQIANVSITQSSYNKDMDDKVLNVIEAMPKWKPGVRNGKAVRATLTITIPIPFRGEEMTIIREEGAPVNVHGRYIIQ